jgi:prepilin-type N-terminal cleavage/methylation domain-containing protein
MAFESPVQPSRHELLIRSLPLDRAPPFAFPPRGKRFLSQGTATERASAVPLDSIRWVACPASARPWRDRCNARRAVWDPRRRRTLQSGFTLPELLAVIAIMTLVGAFGAHAIAGSTRAQETSGLARHLQFQMQRARAEAVADGYQRRMNCSAAGCRLEVATTPGMDPPPSWNNGGDVVDGGTQSAIWAVLPSLALAGAGPSAVAGGSSLIGFFPDGTATAATLFVADINGGNTVRIFLFSATGMARVGSGW